MSETMDRMEVEAEKERKRKGNWTKEDEVYLVEAVTRREGELFGKLEGSCRTQQARGRIWQEITNTLNSKGLGGPRSIGEVKKKFQNIKQKAKAKRLDIIYPKTGGGPKPPSPSVPEQMVLDHLEGRPTLSGVDGGLDSEVSHSIETTSTICAQDLGLLGCFPACIPPLPSCTLTSSDLPQISELSFSNSTIPDLSAQPVTVQPSAIVDVTPSLPVSSSSTGTSYKCTEEAILIEELEKIKENRKLIAEQTALAKLQQKLCVLKIREINPSFIE